MRENLLNLSEVLANYLKRFPIELILKKKIP